MKIDVKVATPEPPPRIVVIELTEREAYALQSVSGNFTGSSNGPRGVMDRLFHGLAEAGFDGYGSGVRVVRRGESPIALIDEFPAEWRK